MPKVGVQTSKYSTKEMKLAGFGVSVVSAYVFGILGGIIVFVIWMRILKKG